ncbi:MAG: hypothetical protein VX346_01960 [Planctomycetota bacterium]|nr:hypothetical protein [Planctomycetota bacterium]
MVELFGLPGSGKTFLTKELTQIIRKGQHSVLDFRRATSPQFYLQDRIRRLSATWIQEQVASRLWIFANPFAAFRLRCELRRSQQPDRDAHRHLFRSWIKTLVRLKRAIRSYDVVLMDQGFLQFIWTVGYESQSPNWLHIRRNLLRQMPAPHAVILVKASQKTAARRLQERPGVSSRVERDGPASVAVMQHAIKLTDELRHDLEMARVDWSQTAFYPINNDADNTPTTELATIAEHLLAHRRQGPAYAQSQSALDVFASAPRPAQSAKP